MSDQDETMRSCSVRMPTDLRETVERHAKAANRSFSREVVFALQQYYASAPEPGGKTKSRK